MNMKTFPPLAAALAASLAFAPAQQRPALLSDPPNGTEAPPLEGRAAFKRAEVLQTTVTRQGGRDIIVQQLALDPNDPVKPVVPEAHAPASAAGASSSPDTAADSFHLLLLSATVYPGPRTHLRWTHHFADGRQQEYSGWSNIDFNHVSGITTLLGSDGKEHSFVMGIGNEETDGDFRSPSFPTTAPTFLPDRRDTPSEALVTIASLHKLYETEGQRLAAAHAGRKQAQAASEAALLANPPQPKDLVIRYRVVETPLAGDPEGGAR